VLLAARIESHGHSTGAETTSPDPVGKFLPAVNRHLIQLDGIYANLRARTQTRKMTNSTTSSSSHHHRAKKPMSRTMTPTAAG
jgi:hypothetical protein